MGAVRLPRVLNWKEALRTDTLQHEMTETAETIKFEFPETADRLLRNCVHCGLCLGACPTYRELGNEADSPRGRLYIMRSLSEGSLQPVPEVTRHLDLCLDCRACETACPSGVQYGQILENTREA